MERNEYIHEFEDFLQEHADMHKLYPSDKIWRNIHQKLHPKPKWPYALAAAILMGLGIAGSHHDKQFVQSSSPLVSSPLAKIIPLQVPTVDRVVQTGTRAMEGTTDAPKPAVHSASFTNHPSPALRTGVKTGRKEDTHNKPATLSMDVAPLSSTHEDVVVSIPQENTTPLTEEKIAEATLLIATLNRLPVVRATEKSPAVSDVLSKNTSRVPRSRSLKFGWQLYSSTTISYRRLSGKGLAYYANAGSNMNSVFSTANVANSVTHKPSVGFELGSALTYSVASNIRVKAGIQFNVNRYDVQAFHSVPEVAPMTRNAGVDGINVVSTFRNYNGFSKTWLRNQHIMMALPVGAEWSLFGNENIRFNIGATLQPTFVVNNQAYMISANMRNYAKAPSLYREFNVAAGAEMFLSIKGRSLRYNIGPQFRYQLFSSYKNPYPISEFLTDYGLKVSIGR